jgi:hypothetical protein
VSAAVVPVVTVASTPRDYITEVSQKKEKKDVVASVAPEPETPAAESTDEVVITSDPEASTEPQQSEDPR